MSRLDDWLTYLDDPDAFDEDHFASSLVDNDPEFAIPPSEMFSFTSNAPLIVERIENLKRRTEFNGLYYVPRFEERMGRDSIVSSCKRCVDELVKFSRLKGDLEGADALASARFTVIDDLDHFHALNTDTIRPRSNAFMKLERSFNRTATSINECYYGAIEAVLSMTNMPMVKNYILNPDVNMSVQFKYFFDLYVGGGQFTDFEEEIVVLIPQEADLVA